ncbi:5'-nucleotidase [Klebsiella pneumoniae]|uniref:5'-nucleotidase n=1 Tax=Klebsiella pneumoniae TaxID=573 RepID=UPI0036D3FA3E
MELSQMILRKLYTKSHVLADFHNYEAQHVNETHNPGPLKDFLQRISDIQKMEEEYREKDPAYRRILRISIVTARNAFTQEPSIR